MNYQFGDRSDQNSRAAKIRALFVPGTTVNEHAAFCMRSGTVWTDSEILGMASREARAEVRAALGQITEEGTPFAGPTFQRKGRAPIWRQCEFWSKRDFDYNYTAYKMRGRQNERIADNIARVCRERYGTDPTDLGDDFVIDDEPES